MRYRVLLRGENFLLKMDGTPMRMGFYTTRFVEADDGEGAELVAVDLIRDDEWLSKSVLNDRSDPPMLFADEIEAVGESDVHGPSSGFTFFPMEGSNA